MLGIPVITATLEDYRWLVREEAAPLLDELTANASSLVQQVSQLRRTLPPARVHLLLEQVEMRARAASKFSDASRMFFTRRSLEQATDEAVARYKASRFPSDQPLADICAGIGGDLRALAEQGPVVGVDRDPAIAVLAEANARLLLDGRPEFQVEVRAADAAEVAVEDFAAWHLDPDRRPTGRRSTRVEGHEPPLDVVERLRRRAANLAIKLAPAAIPPEAWLAEAELEWISRQGECRQLVAWFGQLTSRAGARQATIVDRHGLPLATIAGSADEEMPICSRLGRYLYDPDAAVLAAGLTARLAVQHDLAALAPGSVYLTADHQVDDPALSAFEIVEVLPLDRRRLRRLLRERNIGQLEIKQRGVTHDLDQFRRQLSLSGTTAATLFLTRQGKQAIAILARRLFGR